MTDSETEQDTETYGEKEENEKRPGRIATHTNVKTTKPTPKPLH